MEVLVLKRFKSWYKDNWIYLIIFCLLFSLRICAINNKTNFSFDDPATFNVSTPNNTLDGKKFKYSWLDLHFEYGKNYDALTIKKALFEAKSSPKEIWKDLVTLHNQTLDRQHSNLYYSLVRIWMSGVDYSNPKALIIRGCSLNLIFFIFSFFFMYKLLNLIKKDKKFIALGLFFAFVTTGSISCTLLIRDYPLTEAFFTFALYVFTILYDSIGKNIKISDSKIFLYSLGMSVFFLSYYYSLIVILIMFLWLSYKCYKEKDIKTFENCLLIYFGAILLTLIFCPLYFENFKQMEHMEKAQHSANLWTILNFRFYGVYLIEILIKFVFYNIIFYIILFIAEIFGFPVQGNNKLDKSELKKFTLIYTITLFWTYLICVIAPFHEYAASRYFLPCMPVIGLLLAVATYHFRKCCIIVLLIITFFSSYIPICTNINYENSDFKNLGTVSFFKKDFDYLDIRKYVNDPLTNKPRPVIIYNRIWLWTNYIIYLNNDTIIRFEENLPDKDFIFDNYVLTNEKKINIINKEK